MSHPGSSIGGLAPRELLWHAWNAIFWKLAVIFLRGEAEVILKFACCCNNAWEFVCFPPPPPPPLFCASGTLGNFFFDLCTHYPPHPLPYPTPNSSTKCRGLLWQGPRRPYQREKLPSHDSLAPSYCRHLRNRKRQSGLVMGSDQARDRCAAIKARLGTRNSFSWRYQQTFFKVS